MPSYSGTYLTLSKMYWHSSCIRSYDLDQHLLHYKGRILEKKKETQNLRLIREVLLRLPWLVYVEVPFETCCHWGAIQYVAAIVSLSACQILDYERTNKDSDISRLLWENCIFQVIAQILENQVVRVYKILHELGHFGEFVFAVCFYTSVSHRVARQADGWEKWQNGKRLSRIAHHA